MIRMKRSNRFGRTIAGVFCTLGLAVIGGASSSGGCMSYEEGLEGEIAMSTQVTDWRDEVIYQVLIDRFADGDTGYILCEHGNTKEYAVLHADGTCEYNGMACSADFPPFVELKAKVLPIKARPH